MGGAGRDLVGGDGEELVVELWCVSRFDVPPMKMEPVMVMIWRA